jgi:alcohol dehydrogenase class IV
MQTIYHGIEHLSEALESSNKVLLVCDTSFNFLNIKDDIEHMDVSYVIYNDFTSNPLYEDVCKGVDLFQVTKCDTILAVGGGSSLDVAKCIKLYCQMSKDDIYLNQEYKDTGVKLVAIPTTAGTGSESTRFAVIYYDGKKQSVTHESIIPDVAILEPKVLKTLPLYQKKCTMLDALCQGIESWWSVNSTDESKKLSKETIETIMRWWHEYIFENTDESAKQIMHAANLSGQAICITQTTAAHAFSYKITSMYKFPHGHAVAVCLPVIWTYMAEHLEDCIDKRGIAYLNNVFNNIALSMDTVSTQMAIAKFQDMLHLLEIVNPVSTDRENEIQVLSTSVNPIRLNNNPIRMTFDIICNLYKRIVYEE